MRIHFTSTFIPETVGVSGAGYGIIGFLPVKVR